MTQLMSVVNLCLRQDTLLVLGDFNASTGTDSDDYETCVGPHVSGTVNQTLGWNSCLPVKAGVPQRSVIGPHLITNIHE